MHDAFTKLRVEFLLLLSINIFRFQQSLKGQCHEIFEPHYMILTHLHLDSYSNA